MLTLSGKAWGANAIAQIEVASQSWFAPLWRPCMRAYLVTIYSSTSCRDTASCRHTFEGNTEESRMPPKLSDQCGTVFVRFHSADTTPLMILTCSKGSLILGHILDPYYISYPLYWQGYTRRKQIRFEWYMLAREIDPWTNRETNQRYI